MRHVNRLQRKLAKRLFSICLGYAITAIFSPAITFAQTPTKEYKHQLMFSPFRVIDVVNPGFEVTYNRIISPRFSTAFAGAYMVNPLFARKSHSYKGYRFSLAPRYLFGWRTGTPEYVGPEFVYYKTRFPSEITSHNDPNTGLKSDTFSINKKMISANLLYGRQFCFNYVLVDIAFGLGIKFRDVRHFDRTLPPPGSKEPDILINSRAEMKNVTMNLPINLRIVYQF